MEVEGVPYLKKKEKHPAGGIGRRMFGDCWPSSFIPWSNDVDAGIVVVLVFSQAWK